MSQKASTHLQIFAEPSFDLIANEPWSIDTYADGLMDDLFADIDLILDGSGNLPNQTVPSQYILKTVTVPQIVLPKTLIRRPVQAVPIRKNQLSRIVVGTSAVSKPVSKSRQKLRRALGKLLWMGTTLGLAIAAIMWTLNSGVLNRLASSKLFQQSLQSPQLQSQLPTRGEVEADLVNYMLGALAVLDKQEAKSNRQSAKTLLTASASAKQTALAYVTNRIGNLPPPLAANNTPPASSRSTTIVERIYIPVYQVASPMRYVPPRIAGALNPLPHSRFQSEKQNTALMYREPLGNASQRKLVKTALNTVQKPAKPVTVNALAAVRPELKPIALQAAPVTVRQPPKPLPTLPVARSPVAPPKLPTATTPVSAAPPALAREEVVSVVSTPAVAHFSHTLEGLLELGNKSAALFKIDGSTRRVDMGETIGSSGWTLVDVANGEAIIRRNGEVRSIYAGQKF